MNTKTIRNLTNLLAALMLIALVSVFGMPLMAKAENVVHTVHGGCDLDGSKHEGWTAIDSGDALVSLCRDGGKGYLTSNISVTRCDIPENTDVTLCLNGYSIITGENAAATEMIKLNSNSKFTLYDENENTGKIKSVKEGCYLIYTYSDSEFTMNGGTIGDSKGCGVRVYQGTFTMNEGYISGNTSPIGGGVKLDKGTFIMNGGKIFGNIATQLGGGLYANDGTVILNGGSITGNLSENGGGGYLYGGTITINGGAVSKNAATSKGGGLYLYRTEFKMQVGTVSENQSESDGAGLYSYGGKLTMDEGSIAKNTASNSGGGLYISTATFTMNGGSIAENTSSENGGGVSIYKGTFTINGGSIAKNTASKSGGGLYLDTATFTINGGSISGNNAESGGGGYVYDSTFEMEGGSISENTASRFGGGICSGSLSTLTLNSGNIALNEATEEGGGVYSSGTMTIESGMSIYQNKTGTFGGGVYNWGILTLNGGGFKQNVATSNGGGIFNDGTLFMNSGKIYENSAKEGAGIYSADEFTMKSGTIKNNTASRFGGGVEVKGDFLIEGGEISGNSAVDGKGIFVSAEGLITGGNITDDISVNGSFDIYSITYNPNKGSGNTIRHYYDSANQLVENRFTRSGYSFQNWNTKADGSGKTYNDEVNVVEEDLVLYAQWKPDKYTVKFDANGGSGTMSSQNINYNVSTALSKNSFSRTDYEFNGWNTKADGTGTSYTDGEKVSLTVFNINEITLYAQWKEAEAKYKVEHYKQKLDGTYKKTPDEFDDLTGKVGESVTPAVKSYTGFTSPAVKTATVNADGSTVVKYLYTRKSYKLTWDFDGGSASGEYTTGKVKYQQAITAPVPVKKGYTFDGWSVSVPSTMPAKNLTVKAVWKANYATVTFNVNGGKALTETTKTVQEYTAFGDLPTTTRTGYSFAGWYTAKSGGTKVTAETVCEGNITLYAHWKAKTNTKYKVEHYKQKLDGTYNKKASAIDEFTGKTNASVTPEVKTFEGFTSPATKTEKIKADGSLVIKYYYVRNSYTLTWNLNGGSASETYTEGSVKYGEAITAPVPTKTGYEFNGWSVEVPSKMPAKNLSIKATWKAATDTKYTVEHYKQKLDGTYAAKPGETESLTGTTNSKVTPAVKEYKGFTAPEVQTAKISADGTLVVKYYYTRNSYKLTWDFAGGSAKGSYTKGNVKYGIKITAPVPTKDGYVFTGWDKTVASTMPANDVTYKAKWRKLTQEENVKNFVERFYTIILERPAEAAGLNDWTNRLIGKTATGADVAAGFINSGEFQNKKMTDEEYVTKLYRAFFDREPDKSGYDGWLRELKNGKSRDDVLRGFINSPEFNNLCKKYGINAGSY